MKRFFVCMIVLALAFTAGAQAVKETAATDYPISQITIGTTAAIEKAVPGEYAFDMLSSGVSNLPLVRQDTNGTYHPLLASFSSADSKTWTFTITEGMKWSDGEPVTANDILFTLQSEDENGSANLKDQVGSDGKTTAAKYTEYRISEDGRSISLTLASADVRMLSDMTSFRVMPSHLAGAESQVGNGPYMFESFSSESGTITFVANPAYPQKPNAEKIVFRIFGNDDTMYMALMNGDIDMVWNYSMGVPLTYQDVLASSGNVTLESIPATNAPAVLAFNNAKGPFADENLRKAVSYALDYDAFKQYFGSPYSEVPERGFVPTTTVGYKQTEKLAHDAGKAARYMADAGFNTKDSAGFYTDSSGKRASFTLTVNATKQTHVGYAELVKNQLEAFGIEVILDAVDGTTYNAKTSNRFSENNITMEAAIYGYTAAGMGMLNGLASIYVDGNHAVQGGCQVFDPEFQEILSQMSAALTLDDYIVAAGKLQDFYAEHTPLIALYWDNMILARSSAFGNITMDAVFGLNNAQNWMTITR